MVVWAVAEALVDVIGPKIAYHDAVSHCYERTGFGRYTVFSMIHGKTKDEIMRPFYRSPVLRVLMTSGYSGASGS
jgi:hypothetical protein